MGRALSFVIRVLRRQYKKNEVLSFTDVTSMSVPISGFIFDVLPRLKPCDSIRYKPASRHHRSNDDIATTGEVDFFHGLPHDFITSTTFLAEGWRLTPLLYF